MDALAQFPAAAALFKRMDFVECGLLHNHLWNQDVRLFERML